MNQVSSGIKSGLRNVHASNERIYKKGTLLFIEGDSGGDLFAVKTGKVRLFKHEGASSRLVEECGPGAILGEMGLFENEFRTVTAQVIEESLIMAINREAYQAAINKIPPWIGGSLKSLVRRLVDTVKLTGEEIYRMSTAAVIRVLMLIGESIESKKGAKTRILLSTVYEEICRTMGLGATEIDSVLMHLILKQMICIHKDEMDREFVVLKKPDALYLYMNYLRTRQRGELFPGEHFTRETFDLIGRILSTGGKAEVSDGVRFISVSVEKIAQAGAGMELASVKQLTDADCIIVENGFVRYNKEKMNLMNLLGEWLAIFKEEIKL